MKYEMIFGDEALFDGAPEDAEYAGWFCQETRWYMVLNGKILFSDGGTWCTSDNPYLSADIAAMRRIIKEPKRWTWEDKKAWRLPEVGANVIGKRAVLCYEVALVTEKEIILKCCSGICHTYKHNVFIEFFYPIQTPEEKAQREEDEFVADLYRKSIQDETFEQGARAAYRKLKGGE